MTEIFSNKSDPYTAANSSSKTILIIDDDKFIVGFFSEILRDAGHQTLGADNVGDGLHLLDTNPVDLVISDLHMPELSGYDLLAEVKKHHPHVPVIIITGDGRVKAAVDSLKYGAEDFINKPCSPSAITDTVDVVLSKYYRLGNAGDPEPLAAMPFTDYTIIDRIGEGSMGTVFHAVKIVDGRKQHFAIKLLKRLDLDRERNKTLIKRFVHEAIALSRVNHPNIVKITEYGIDEALKGNYIVMEYIDGDSLSSLMQRQHEFSYYEKSIILRQIADALSAVHDLNLCHRDIKPSNIMVDKELRVTLTDFGLVKLPESFLTATQEMMGSPAYMSPESFRTSRTDQRSDIFSFGSLAYEFYLGSPPFKGETIFRLSHAIQNDIPETPTKLADDFPEVLQDLLGRMLRKNPDDRCASMDEVKRDLSNYMETAADSDVPKQSKWVSGPE